MGKVVHESKFLKLLLLKSGKLSHFIFRDLLILTKMREKLRILYFKRERNLLFFAVGRRVAPIVQSKGFWSRFVTVGGQEFCHS